MGQIIHHEDKDVISRGEALMRAFGWQGGTIHQICELINIDPHDLIYAAQNEHEFANKCGWFAYRTNSLEFNQEKIFPAMKGNLQFWLGVCSGVQTTIKLGEEVKQKF